MIPYYKQWSDWDFDWVPLNPTGRWKEKRSESGELTMYIEHKGFIFKRWIHERDIGFFPRVSETTIHECKRD